MDARHRRYLGLLLLSKYGVLCACFVADGLKHVSTVQDVGCHCKPEDFEFRLMFSLHPLYLYCSREQDGEGDVLCSLEALQQRLQDLAESQERTSRYG